MSDTPARTSYELFVGRRLSPATLATFPVALVPTPVPRNTVRRLRVGADRDIAEIVRTLTERDIALIDIRRSPQFPRPDPEPRARWNVPSEDDGGSAVVVPLPREAASDAAVEGTGTAVAPISLAERSGAGAGRARRQRRRAARG